MTKISDRYISGNTDDLTGWDYLFAAVDIIPLVGKIIKGGGKGVKALVKYGDEIVKGLDDLVDIMRRGPDGKPGGKPKVATPKTDKPQPEVKKEARNRDGTGSGTKTNEPSKPKQPPVRRPGMAKPPKKDLDLEKQEGITKSRNAKDPEVKRQILRDHGFDDEGIEYLMGNGQVCFVAGTAGTQVITEQGLKNIEDIEVGDVVLSQDEKGGQLTYCEVLDTFVTHPNALYHVFYQSEDGEEELITTAEHPFFITNKGNWFRAAELEPGDLLYLANGNSAEMVRLEIERGPPTNAFSTYNIAVAGTRTYFVVPSGAVRDKNAVWVHNTGKYCNDYDLLLGLAMNDKSLKGSQMALNKTKGAARKIETYWSKVNLEDQVVNQTQLSMIKLESQLKSLIMGAKEIHFKLDGFINEGDLVDLA